MSEAYDATLPVYWSGHVRCRDRFHLHDGTSTRLFFVQMGSIAMVLCSLLAFLPLPETSGAYPSVPGYVYILLGVVYWRVGRWSKHALTHTV